MKKTLFCANEQADVAHSLSASPSGELELTCDTCARVVKFPSGLTKEAFLELVSKHKEANEGQVTVESIDKMLSEFADEV